MRISFIRHQRCYNHREDGTYNYNTINPPLTKSGIEGAALLKGEYDLIIISPMARCIETYAYSHLSGPREINALFREWRQGPGDFHNHDHPSVFCESPQELELRIAEAFTYLESLKGTYENVCVITHSEWMKKALKLDNVPDYGETVIKYL